MRNPKYPMFIESIANVFLTKGRRQIAVSDTMQEGMRREDEETDRGLRWNAGKHGKGTVSGSLFFRLTLSFSRASPTNNIQNGKTDRNNRKSRGIKRLILKGTHE